MKFQFCSIPLLVLLLCGCEAPDPTGKRVPTSSTDRPSANNSDHYLWLEDVMGERSQCWVREQNEACTTALRSLPDFEPTRKRLLEIFHAEERIPRVRKRGRLLYNFWRDEKHPRGVWRRTSTEEYRKPKPEWELVLDLDALATSERENWVWKGSVMLEPQCERCLLALSRGGADAAVYREFDLTRKEFVRDGFILPEAKSVV